MKTNGLNKMKAQQLRSQVATITKISSGHIAELSDKFNCTEEVVADFVGFKLKKKAQPYDGTKDEEIKLLKGELHSHKDTMKAMQGELDDLKANKANHTGKGLYDTYAEGVGGNLPDFAKLGGEQKGWMAVVDLVNK